MELLKNTLRYQRQVARQTAYREESAESIVPDTLPDIARIVDATGTAYIRDWELGSDEVTVKCTVRASVLYMAEEDKKLYKVEVPVSFSQRVELRGAEPDCDALCSCLLVSADARAINPRKISVRVNVAITPRLYAKTEESFTTGVDDTRECCVKTETVGYAAVTSVSYKNFTLVEDIDIPETAGSVRSVLRSEMHIRPTDIKLMTNRVVVRAEADVMALCEDAEGNYIRIERTFGFTQMADVPGVEEEYDASIDFGLRSFELDPALDMSGDSRYLSLSASVIMNMEISQNAQMDIVTDLYGTRRNSSLTMRDVVLAGTAEPRSYKAFASEHVNAAIPVKRIIDQRIQTDEAAEHLPGEKSATVGAMVSVLCMGDDGAYYNLVRRIPLTFEAGTEAPSRVKTDVQTFDVTASGSGGLDIEISATVYAGEERAKRVAMVDAIEWGEEFPPDGYSRMSALIRRVTGDETLWEIAREYHTTVDAIALANQMSTDSVPNRGELLLIPMKK